LGSLLSLTINRDPKQPPDELPPRTDDENPQYLYTRIRPGKRALVVFEYKRATEDELNLYPDEIISHIVITSEGWWHGSDSHGNAGLFPSSNVSVLDGLDDWPSSDPGLDMERCLRPVRLLRSSGPSGLEATTLWLYTSQRSGELSFPIDARITNVIVSDRP
jgi:hypothetical protein